MNTNTIKRIVLAIFAFAATGALSMGATFTWNGGGIDNNWTTGANWVGGVKPGSAQTLEFDGTSRLAPTNDNIGYAFYGITFRESAGAFTLGGNDISLYRGLTNYSTNTQSIAFGMALAENVAVHTIKGNITSQAGIGQSVTNRSLIKDGLKTLTLQGTNTYQGFTAIYAGKLTLDYSGGGSFSSTNIHFGNQTIYANGNTATLEVKGSASPALPVLVVPTYAAAKIGSSGKFMFRPR